MKKFLNYTLIILFTLSVNGCNLQDWADEGEYDDYSDSSNTTSTIFTVSSGAPILNAFVVDVDDKVASNIIGTNKYRFTGSIRYPIRAYGGYSDVNTDGVINQADISNNITLRTNKGLNLTLLTTYISAEPDTSNSDTRVYYKVDTDIENTFGILVANQYKLPKDNLKVAAFNHSIFKKAQNNLTIVGTELNNIVDNDFLTDFNSKVSNYTVDFNNGVPLSTIAKLGERDMFNNGELLVNNTFLFKPDSLVDLNNTNFNTQPNFLVSGLTSSGGVITNQTVSDDSVNSSIPIILYQYGLIQQQIDILNLAVTKYGYAELSTAITYNQNALSKLTNLLTYFEVFTKPTYASWNFTLPTATNSYFISSKNPGSTYSPFLNTFFTNSKNSLNNDDNLDFSIFLVRFDYNESLPFAKTMIEKYNPNLQYLFRGIYLDIVNSRNVLVDLSKRL
jgi:hypothetical protein